MAKQNQNLKLPDDFIGTVTAFLNTPPPEKKARKPTKRKSGMSPSGSADQEKDDDY